MKVRTKYIAIAYSMLIVIAVGTGSGCTGQTQTYKGPFTEITLGAYAGDTASLVWIAQDQGYFLANGLDVTIKGYEAGKLAADALLADEVDIATLAEFVLVSSSFDHDDLRVLGTVATGNVVELVARIDRDIQHPSDLKDKSIGVTRKSTGEFFLGRFLLFNGISLHEVTIVDLSPSEIVEAISNDEIDAALTWDPNIYEIKNRLGENWVSWPGQSGQDFYFILLGKEGWVETHASAVERFLKAIVQAEEFVERNREAAQQLIGQRFDNEPAYMQYIWSKHDFVVILPQTLIVVMEDEARWRMENNLTDQTTIPNYLDFIYFDGLEVVKPESITVIR